jgi:hypothetical protein
MDWIILVGMGSFFIVVGLVLVLTGRSGEGNYIESLARRPDLRKYVQHQSLTLYEAWKLGGWVTLIVGIVMAAVGGVLWYW